MGESRDGCESLRSLDDLKGAQAAFRLRMTTALEDSSEELQLPHRFRRVRHRNHERYEEAPVGINGAPSISHPGFSQTSLNGLGPG
jgi:hypothetical protein